MSEGESAARTVDELISAAAGQRPLFLDDVPSEKVIDAVFRLAMELCVLRDRMDVYEAFMAEQVPDLARRIDDYEPPAELEAARRERRLGLVRRLVRDLS